MLLSAAAKARKVEVKFLLNGNATRRQKVEIVMKSLLKINGANIEAKFHEARIKKFHGLHSKYMVTESGGFMGSSNWSQDYFTTTAGLGFIFEAINRTEADKLPSFWRNVEVSAILHSQQNPDHSRNMQQEMKAVFDRDWNSEFSVAIKKTTREAEKKVWSIQTKSLIYLYE